MSKTQYIIEKTEDYILLRDVDTGEHVFSGDNMEDISDFLQQKWYNYYRCENCGEILKNETNHKHHWSIGRSMGMSWSCGKAQIQ